MEDIQIIDARGEACPKPVILVRKAIKIEQPNRLKIMVDNLIATQNLAKMAIQLGYDCQVESAEKNQYDVFLEKTNRVKTIERNEMTDDKVMGEQTEQFVEENRLDKISKSAYIVVIKSDEMGGGESVFSKVLLEGFIYALSEQENLPEAVIFYNRGVFMTSVNQKAVSDVQKMADQGVEILSCGLCLDNYQLKEQLQIGQVTNMYTICEMMCHYRVVSPC